MFEDLIPDLREPAAALLQAAGADGLLPQVTSTRRTRSAQERLYRRWQSGLSPFPAAPPGTSAHEYGYAFDMVVSPLEALADVGYTWEAWGGLWGGDRDPIHFQYPGFVVPRSLTLQQQAGTSGWEQFIAGLPISFWPSALLSLLGIPTSATKDITPAQEETFRKIAAGL